MKHEDNIVLVGMPGVGKSTVGVLLAKATSRDFIDTDVVIQSREHRRLQEIIDAEGRAAFCALEEKHVLSLEPRGHVIATGGSVVYSDRAMKHLKKNGVIVHLDLPLETLEARLTDLDSRGVVMDPHQDLAVLYRERAPLYCRYTDLCVDCSGLDHEQVVEAILLMLGIHRSAW